ncbi:PilN domain-containing protein, partial [Leptolyngbya sp. FACHB-36]|uniref:PilN domain-containing protein n=1 Tax=Leptolyngbya sp. FACHB-36 TaxID=2692808 RepID=UPI0019849DBF
CDMYGLDINFLNDRPEYKPDAASRTKTRSVAASSGDRRPLVLGAIAAVLLPALALGSWLYLQNRNADLAQQQADLDRQLGALAAQKNELTNINNQAKQAREETTALATVFNQIKPWSAILQDLRDLTPNNVQITAIKQTVPRPGQAAPQPSPRPQANASPQPNAAPSPVAASTIEISGLAESTGAVGDYLILLQSSNFLDAKKTELIKSQLQQSQERLQLPRLGQNTQRTTTFDEKNLPSLPQRVEFTVRTALNEVPASELVRELNRKGAAGLVTRIEALQRKGVVQK